MKENRVYEIDDRKEVLFHNNVDFCIGTGRMGLALQQAYQDQLRMVQDEIGFRHIRGHGLFSDDMAIYQEYEDASGVKRAEYNFTYLDMVMDSYRKCGLKPFLELGFMPDKMASGKQTIFYWKGNVTPPKDYQAWCDLVCATLRHLMERYGEEEVLTWPIEVWNEPNLPGFWKDADMEEYFKLFHRTFDAIKALNVRFRVGGPAICGVEDELWIREFLNYCRKEKLMPDFITRHHYTTEFPKPEGHYGYAALSDAEQGFDNLRSTRDIIDSFEEYRGLEIHITEFNTSYIPNCPLHDTNQNAAYIAQQLSRLGDVNESYSYWTFGDIFEEQGVPFTPFHGGFGLVANGCIPKPTFWTFRFYKELCGKCVHKSDDMVIVSTENGGYQGIAWNAAGKRQDRELQFDLVFPAVKGKEYSLIKKTVDEDTCNPLRMWHDMGEPASLDEKQKKLLQDCARPFISGNRLAASEEKLSVSLTVKEFGVVYFELQPIKAENDRGFDYNRAVLN
ncbi:MAG: xylan 1,4-beta-xylosidase [Lachnospiraceae bacterium]|nr:xylan 1,4-beta-xylosidase [Lachnospiraceae bacterium]